MALIDWKDSFSVNIAEIDEQHKKLVMLINELHDAMRDRRAKDVLANIIVELIRYTTTHFSTEEQYFDKYNYPSALAHKKEHKDFVKKAIEFRQGFEEGKLMLSTDIMDFLKDWLVEHIQGVDKKYSVFFNEKGLK